MEGLGRVVLERLIRYYRYVADVVAEQGAQTVTSGEVGRALDVDPSQVRKDFAAVGLMGMSRVGYDVCEVCRTIRDVAGFDSQYRAVLIGAGMLGSALLSYTEFQRFGLRVVAAFDNDPFKVGRKIGGHAIRPMDEMVAFIKEHRIPLAILTVPGDVAQDVTDILVLAGVKALWNFTPVRLEVPAGVLARNERLSAGLAEIAYHLKPSDATPEAAARTLAATR